MPRHTAKRSDPRLADLLVSLRKSRGLSQQQLATQAGMSMCRLAEAERYGAATPDTVASLAAVLGTEVDDLTGRSSGALVARLAGLAAKAAEGINYLRENVAALPAEHPLRRDAESRAVTLSKAVGELESLVREAARGGE